MSLANLLKQNTNRVDVYTKDLIVTGQIDLSGDINITGADGSVLYLNNQELQKLPIGTNGQVLTVSGDNPVWDNIPPASSNFTTPVLISGSNSTTKLNVKSSDNVNNFNVDTSDGIVTIGRTSKGETIIDSPLLNVTTSLQIGNTTNTWNASGDLTTRDIITDTVQIASVQDTKPFNNQYAIDGNLPVSLSTASQDVIFSSDGAFIQFSSVNIFRGIQLSFFQFSDPNMTFSIQYFDSIGYSQINTSIVDVTNGFQQNGSITWDLTTIPSWVVDGNNRYDLIVIRNSPALTQLPIFNNNGLNLIFSGELFTWEQNGDINCKDITCRNIEIVDLASTVDETTFPMMISPTGVVTRSTLAGLNVSKSLATSTNGVNIPINVSTPSTTGQVLVYNSVNQNATWENPNSNFTTLTVTDLTIENTLQMGDTPSNQPFNNEYSIDGNPPVSLATASQDAPFTTQGSFIAITSERKFKGIDVTLFQFSNPAMTIGIQYYDGVNFSALVIFNDNINFIQNGAILWDIQNMPNWSVNGNNLYEIRIVRTNVSLTTSPIFNNNGLTLRIIPPPSFDISGNINSNSLNIIDLDAGSFTSQTSYGVIWDSDTDRILRNPIPGLPPPNYTFGTFTGGTAAANMNIGSSKADTGFTLVLTSSGTTSGWWQRVGKVVFCRMRIQWSAKSGTTGNPIYVWLPTTGLPQPENPSTHRFPVTIGIATGITVGNVEPLTAFMFEESGAPTIRFYCSNADSIRSDYSSSNVITFSCTYFTEVP